MKLRGLLLSALLLAAIGGCALPHDRVGDAPRTEAPASTSGWKSITTSGASLDLPSDWKSTDFATSTFEAGSDKMFGNDPKFAEMRQQASAMAKNGTIKLFAFDTAMLNKGFGTNCNFGVVQEPIFATVDMVAEATVKQLAPTVVAGSQPDLQYVQLSAGRAAVLSSRLKTANPSLPELSSLMYILIKDSKAYLVTFTTTPNDAARIRGIADHTMSTFHYTQ